MATSGFIQAHPGAEAQTHQSPSATTSPVWNPFQKQSSANRNDVTRKLDRQVEIPNMPSYPGKTQYLNGKVLEVPGANTYTMSFLAMDPPSRVRDWYIQALSSYDWKQTMHPTPTLVSAMAKDGSGLTVSISETGTAPFKSQVMVMYHERVKSK